MEQRVFSLLFTFLKRNRQLQEEEHHEIQRQDDERLRFRRIFFQVVKCLRRHRTQRWQRFFRRQKELEAGFFALLARHYPRSPDRYVF